MTPNVLANVLFSACQIHRQQLTLEQQRVQLKALEMQLDYRRDRLDANVSLTRDLIRALIDRRIQATESGFYAVLALYEVQNNKYTEQLGELSDAMVREKDPLDRANLDARLNKIDVELRQIQVSGRELLQNMNCMLLAIGGTALVPTTDFQRTIAIERGTPS